jgi:hypothetical protein
MPTISVALFVEVLAVLTTGYVLTVSCLFLGYFLGLEFRFISLFSVFDFTSQAVVLFPFVVAVLFVFTAGAQVLDSIARRFNVPFREVLWGLGVLAAFAVAIGDFLDIRLFDDSAAVEEVLTIVLVGLALLCGALLFELQKELNAQPPKWLAAAVSLVMLIAATSAALLSIGVYWAQADLQRGDNIAVYSNVNTCSDVRLLKSSAAGVLVLSRTANALEFHAFESIRNMRAGECQPER